MKTLRKSINELELFELREFYNQIWDLRKYFANRKSKVRRDFQERGIYEFYCRKYGKIHNIYKTRKLAEKICDIIEKKLIIFDTRTRKINKNKIYEKNKKYQEEAKRFYNENKELLSRNELSRGICRITSCNRAIDWIKNFENKRIFVEKLGIPKEFNALFFEVVREIIKEFKRIDYRFNLSLIPRSIAKTSIFLAYDHPEIVKTEKIQQITKHRFSNLIEFPTATLKKYMNHYTKNSGYILR